MLTKLFARIPFRKIDLYLFLEVLSPFLGGVLFFTFIFLMFQALRLIEFFIVHNIPGLIILKLAFLLSLSFLPTALPIAFLIAVLVGFGRLSADAELVAMKSSGISVYRMAIPVLALGVIIVGLSLALNLSWVPWGHREYRRTVIKVGNTKVVSSIQEGTFTSGFFDLLVFAEKVNPRTNQLTNVFIFDEREPKNPMTIVAKKGEIVPVRADSVLGSAVMLHLEQGNIHRSDIATEVYQKIDFGDYRLFLKIIEGEDNASSSRPKMLPYHQLLEKINQAEPNSYGAREHKTELWRRYSVAVSALIFVFLGIGFGTIKTRSVRSGAALIAFVVILAYWGMQVGVTALSHNGMVAPFIAMQLPNIILLAIALYFFRKAAW